MSKIRVMTYINQFFAGIGGEDNDYSGGMDYTCRAY